MKNREGYTDNTTEHVIRNASRIPHHINEVYKALDCVESLHSMEIIGLRDKKTGKKLGL